MAVSRTGIRYELIAQDRASRDFDRVGRSAGRLHGGIGRLSGAAKGAGLALAGLAGAASASALIKMSANFAGSMRKIQTQAGGTAKDVGVLSKAVLNLAKTTQQGPQELADSLYHLKSVGMDNVAAMRALKVATDLAAVGGSDLEGTTNALAGAWRTGIKGAQSFREAAGTVNAVIGAGNMRMEQFVEAIGTGILPSAKTFGLSLKQVGAALALMTDEGVPAVDAATRLRMSFSLLGAPSAAADKVLHKIGLSGIQLANAMRSKGGLIAAVTLLKEHLDHSGLSAARQSQILSRAFGGGRSSAGIMAMVNNLDVLVKKQEQINRSVSKFPDAVKIQRRGAIAQWNILKSNLEVVGIKLGASLLPPIASFVKYINTSAIPAVGRFAHAMGRMIPTDEIKAGFKGVKDTVGDLFQGLSGGTKKKPPIGRTVQTGRGFDIQSATPIPKPKAVTVRTNRGLDVQAVPQQKKQLSSAEKFGKQIRDAVSGGVESIDWKKVGGGLGTLFTSVAGHTNDFVNKFSDSLGKVDWVTVGGKAGKTAIPFIIGFTNNLIEPLMHGSFWKKHWLDALLAALATIPIGKVGGAAAKLFEKIPWGRILERSFGPVGRALAKVFGPVGRFFDRMVPGWIRGGSRAIGRFGSAIGRSIGGLATTVGRGIGRFAASIGRSIGGFFTRAMPRATAAIVREFRLLPTRLGVLAIDFERAAVRWVRGIADGFGSRVPWLIRKVGKFLTRFTFYKTGINLMQGLLSGIADKIRDLGGWLKSHVVDPVVNWVTSGFGIASPSTVFASIGRQLPAGLRRGILAGIKGIGGWLGKHVVSPVTRRFAGAGSWLTSHGRQLVSGFKSGVWGVAKSIGGWLGSHVVSPVKGKFKNAYGWLPARGRALISGLKFGIVDGISGIGKWIKKNVIDPIVGAVKHFFGIKSPSTVFHGIGLNLVRGLIRGLASTNGTSIAKKIFGSMPDALGAIVNKGLVSIESLPGKALSALGRVGGKLGDLLGGLLGFSGGGGSSANQRLGHRMMLAAGFSESNWPALRALWMGESGWRTGAYNRSSGATGIPQSLPGSKMASAGRDWRTNPATQIRWGLSYIKSRYGSPSRAYATWLRRRPHWYDRGGVATGAGFLPKLTPKPERVLDPRMTVAFEEFIEWLKSGRGGGQGATVVNVQPPPADVPELIDGINWALRKARRGGRFAAARP